MFKNISIKKARKITAIICVLIGIAACCNFMSSCDNLFSLEAFLGVFIGLGLSALLYMAIELSIFARRESRENAISYVQSFLSKDEYRKVNLKLEDNEFIKLSIEESRISYYAKIKSDEEIEISIVKDDKIISTKVIDLFSFKRFFTD